MPAWQGDVHWFILLPLCVVVLMYATLCPHCHTESTVWQLIVRSDTRVPPSHSPNQSRQHHTLTHTMNNDATQIVSYRLALRVGGWLTIESSNTLCFAFCCVWNSVCFIRSHSFLLGFFSFSHSTFWIGLVGLLLTNQSISRFACQTCTCMLACYNHLIHSTYSHSVFYQKQWTVSQFCSILFLNKNRSYDDSLYWIELDKLHLCLALFRSSYFSSLA